MRLGVTAVSIWMLCIAPPTMASNARPFVPGSFDQLVAERADEPFLLIIWSVTCVPCRDEFRLIADLRRSEGDFPVVLISTDSIDDLPIAKRMLDEYGLADLESGREVSLADARARLGLE